MLFELRPFFPLCYEVVNALNYSLKIGFSIFMSVMAERSMLDMEDELSVPIASAENIGQGYNSVKSMGHILKCGPISLIMFT